MSNIVILEKLLELNLVLMNNIKHNSSISDLTENPLIISYLLKSNNNYSKIAEIIRDIQNEVLENE